MGQPSRAAVAAIGLHRQSRQVSAVSKYFDGAARATTAATIIRHVERVESVRRDRSGSDNRSRVQQHDAAALCAAAERASAVAGSSSRGEIPGAVIGVSGAAASAKNKRAGGRDKRRAAEAAHDSRALPAEPAVAARAAIAACAATGVLIVCCRIRVRRAATGVSWCAARIAAIRISLDDGLRCADRGRGRRKSRRWCHVVRCSGDAFTLRRIGVNRR